jgi:transposase-like protein
VQPKAKADLKEIWQAENRTDAEKAFDRFLAKYDKAAGCLAKDREALLAFYDFPAEHWKHIRTGNPIESTFATVRHRTTRAKGCLSDATGAIMVVQTDQRRAKLLAPPRWTKSGAETNHRRQIHRRHRSRPRKRRRLTRKPVTKIHA